MGSLAHHLAPLPVTNPTPAIYQILEMTMHRSGNGADRHRHHGYRVVVVPIARREPAPITLPYRHTANWRCRVIASNHPDHPVGGPPIIMSTSELRRARIVDL